MSKISDGFINSDGCIDSPAMYSHLLAPLVLKPINGTRMSKNKLMAYNINALVLAAPLLILDIKITVNIEIKTNARWRLKK
ncbi:hypothetical protein FACS1894152_3240 [Bacilli bacterium]|nr:hypothetical protein FACS1894152_3240 [Bacilli bacterium]